MFFGFFHFDEKYPLPRPKNDLPPIWAMWYQFRHVWKGQMTCALELKPYFHNNEDPWKKNWHFKYWNWPRCNQNIQILAKKSISQYGYLKRSKWAVLRNLSLISIIMRIGEKKLGCLNTKNLWLATMLLFFICVFCSEVFWYYDTPIFFTDPRYLWYKA